ncbi:MAG: hypothetical protein KJ042_13425 [Deltaproteobacteria bacterium]|nr:hypothetical protein [Deltaproteobacteria bacterium]
MRRWAIVSIIVLAGIAAGTSALGAPIHVMSLGDSWADGWTDEMQSVLLAHGQLATVFDFGEPGSTATLWAAPNSLLLLNALAYLAGHSEVQWVVISLGGNDLLDGYLLGGYGDGVFPVIDESLRTVIDAILAIRPQMKISVNGYDFPNFEQSAQCILLGQAMLGGNTYTQNLLFGDLTQITQDIAADYDQVHAVDLLGTLQEVDHVAGAPNYLRPSPARFFPTDDCIHPSRNNGYRHLQERIWEGFFDPILNPTTTTTTTTTTTSTTTTTQPGDDDSDDDADDDTDDDASDDDADDDWFPDDDDGTIDDDAGDDDASANDDDGEPSSSGNNGSSGCGF